MNCEMKKAVVDTQKRVGMLCIVSPVHLIWRNVHGSKKKKKKKHSKRTYKNNIKKKGFKETNLIFFLFFIYYNHQSGLLSLLLFQFSSYSKSSADFFFSPYLDEIWTEMLKYWEKSSFVNFPELALKSCYCGNVGFLPFSFFLFFVCVCVCGCVCVLFCLIVY